MNNTRKTICAIAIAAFSMSAMAITNLSVGDSYYLGWVDLPGNSNPTSEGAAIENLHKQIIGYTDAPIPLTTISRENSTQPALANPVVEFTGKNDNSTNGGLPFFNLDGSTLYILSKYAGFSHVWYVAGLDDAITVPQNALGKYKDIKERSTVIGYEDKINGLSHTSKFGGGGTTKVPDAGATLILLGSALGVLGLARRRFAK